MISVSESIVIAADRDQVFEYLDDPQNHREITPSLVRVENIQPLENGGKELDHTYELGGVELDGSLHQTVHDPPSRMTFDMEGRLEGEIDITLEEHEDGTAVTYSAGYDLPGAVLERLADPFVRRYNERELTTTLENLQTRLETR